MKPTGRLRRLALWLLLAVVLCVWALSWGRIAWVEKQLPEGATSQGRWVQAQDVKLHIQEYGDAAHPTLLLVAGTGAWAQTWVSNVDAMVAAGYHVVAVDLPPFGYSTRPQNGDYSRQAQARRLLALMAELKLGPLTLLGHSYGGGPAAEAAVLQPAQVSHLILLDAAIGLRQDGIVQPPEKPGLGMRLFGVRPLRTTVIALLGTQPAFAEYWLSQFVYRKEVVTAQRTAIYRAPFSVQGFSAALGDWAYQFAGEHGQSLSEQASAYRTLPMRVSLIWGAQDQITPLAQARELQALMPQAALQVLPGVGHIPQIEDVDLFNRSLSAVLAGP
jgi:pimeloyl-ACP methyl ester carboxylesterase